MTDKNLGQLIATLKAEAIETAEQEAAKILEDAHSKAQEILEQAEKKKEALLADAEQEAQNMLDKGTSALKQAGRDYCISVRNELLQIFGSVLKEETQQEFTPDLLKTAILRVVENIGEDVELNLAPDFSAELAEFIHERLKGSPQTVSLLDHNPVLKGFSVSNTRQGWSYSISPEEVGEALRTHLNSNWMHILQKAD
jgi:V/A-type H+-transporting ATPase subunit E